MLSEPPLARRAIEPASRQRRYRSSSAIQRRLDIGLRGKRVADNNLARAKGGEVRRKASRLDGLGREFAGRDVGPGESRRFGSHPPEGGEIAVTLRVEQAFFGQGSGRDE